MSILTLDGIIEGLRPSDHFLKNGPTTVAGRLFSLLYSSGSPGAAAAPSPGTAGAALTTYAGQLPYTNPGGGDLSYLARFAASSTQDGTLILCDRLWHNSGLSPTSTSPQTVSSVAFPARDRVGTVNGAGVLIGLEVSAALGSGVPTLSMDYTNQDGTAGRTGTSAAITASSAAGSFYPIPLQSGDSGVQAINTFTLSASMVSGTFHLVAYRPLATLNLRAGVGDALDALAAGFPQLYDNTVPFLLFLPAGTTAPIVMGQLVTAQG